MIYRSATAATLTGSSLSSAIEDLAGATSLPYKTRLALVQMLAWNSEERWDYYATLEVGRQGRCYTLWRLVASVSDFPAPRTNEAGALLFERIPTSLELLAAIRTLRH